MGSFRPPTGKVVNVVAGQVYVSARRSTILAYLRDPVKASDLTIGGEVGLEWFKDRAYITGVLTRNIAATQVVVTPSGLRAQAGVLRWDWCDPGAELLRFEVDACRSMDVSAVPYPLSAGRSQYHQPVLAGTYYYRVRAVASSGIASSWSAWAGPMVSTGGVITSAGGGTSGTVGVGPHNLLSTAHTDTDAGDVPAKDDLAHYTGSRWDAISLRDLIAMIGADAGREDGWRFGFWPERDGRWFLGVLDTAGVALFGVSLVPDEPGTSTMVIGYGDKNHIRLAPAATTEFEAHRDVQADVGCLDATGITDGYVPTASGGQTSWAAAGAGHSPATLAATALALLSLSGQELSLPVRASGSFLAGPVTGSAAAPTFRGIELSDLPPLPAGTPAATVESETTWGVTPAVGTDTEYARQDHTHGTPALPSAGDIGAAPADHTHAQLHDAATVADTSTVNLSITGQQISGAVIPGGIDHGDLAGLSDADHPASAITVNTGGFSGNLSGTDDTVQKALDTIDDLALGSGLTVREIDTTPSVAATILEVPNGTLSNEGGGVARLAYAAAVHSHGEGTSGVDSTLALMGLLGWI